MLSVAACPQDMDADVNTHVSLALPPSPCPSLPPCVDAAHVRHRQIVAYKKCIAWDEEPGQARPGQPAACTESNRIDGNFFSFAKVLRRMCHMDRSRNSSSPALPRPCSVHKCRRKYICSGEQQPSEFSVFCAFLKWANLCDTLRQLIKLNKHEAGPEEEERTISNENCKL